MREEWLLAYWSKLSSRPDLRGVPLPRFFGFLVRLAGWSLFKLSDAVATGSSVAGVTSTASGPSGRTIGSDSVWPTSGSAMGRIAADSTAPGLAGVSGVSKL